MEQDLFSEAKRAGYKCSCCGQYVKLYSRRLSGSMCAVLLLIYRVNPNGWVHVENLLKEKRKENWRADFHKLTWWGFIEKKTGEHENESPRNGYYKITGRGIAFCMGDYKAKERVLICNNECYGFEGNDTTIREALGVRFDYNDLMAS